MRERLGGGLYGLRVAAGRGRVDAVGDLADALASEAGVTDGQHLW